MTRLDSIWVLLRASRICGNSEAHMRPPTSNLTHSAMCAPPPPFLQRSRSSSRLSREFDSDLPVTCTNRGYRKRTSASFEHSASLSVSMHPCNGAATPPALLLPHAPGACTPLLFSNKLSKLASAGGRSLNLLPSALSAKVVRTSAAKSANTEARISDNWRPASEFSTAARCGGREIVLSDTSTWHTFEGTLPRGSTGRAIPSRKGKGPSSSMRYVAGRFGIRV
mmetsp:Transcript_4930/g.7231  ORF Transcript_4930/g.7231 Transcript_4930/m.7231 type:complete len:224 (-) Transcript_4930:146-817(-)